MNSSTPTDNTNLRKRLADFGTVTDALDYAARGATGCNFYSSRGELTDVLTYADLCSFAKDHAQRLIGMGLESGDRIAILASTTPDFPVLFFACQYAGLVPVPLPVPTAFGRREAYIEQISAQIKLSGSRILIGPVDLIKIVKEEIDMSRLLLCGTRDDII
ncbi:uncharacterized protein METZ01_LOCUS446962, partial [marine metagenome]